MMKITMAAATLVLAAGAQAKSTVVRKAQPAPTAQPTPFTTYKLRTGEVVNMSDSQKNIINGVWHTPSPQRIAAVAARITVTILVEKNDGTSMLGTGFYTDKNHVLTNWHVVRNAKKITVIDSDRVRYEGATIVNGNPSMDVGVISVPGADSKYVSWLDTDSDWEQVGEKVYVYGNPEGLEGTFSDGMLSSIRADGAIFQISVPIDHGNSGSPVFNQYGLVIGIVSMGLDSKAQLNFAISTNAIMEALRGTNADHPKGFNLGITKGLELRNREELAMDAGISAESAKAQYEAFEQIIDDIKIYTSDRAAFDKWVADIRQFAPWDIKRDYWVREIGRQTSNKFYIVDVNKLLKLQGLPEVEDVAQVAPPAGHQELQPPKSEAADAPVAGRGQMGDSPANT